MSKFIILGGGCFWCLEAVYQRVEGVLSVVSGYAGGGTVDPTYEQICSGKTGHAEVIKIEFDDSKTDLDKLLNTFWKIHDPTTLNRQGNDVGDQYRSVVFYENEEEKEIIQKSIDALVKQRVYSDNIVTQVLPLPAFYPAEDYHQNYFNQHPNQGYCQLVIRPKLQKVQSINAR